MERIYGISIDLKDTTATSTKITFKQYDYGTSFIAVQLLSESKPLSIINEIVVAVFKNGNGLTLLNKKGKAVKSYAYVDDPSNGIILLPIPKEVLKVAGTVSCELVILSSDGEQRRTTQLFSFNIVDSLAEIKEIEIPPELKAICGRFLCGEVKAGQNLAEVYTLDSNGNYIPTNWIDGVTPVNARNLNKIESAIEQIANKVLNITAENISYETSADSNITSIKDALDKLLYVSLNISLSTSKTTFEKGENINSITFNWSYNKSIVSQSFDGNTLEKSVRTFTYNTPFNNNKSFKLVANDGKADFSKSISISFLNGRYWGVSNNSNYDSSFIKSLNKELNESRAKTFTVNCGVDQHIYYCFPSRLGTPTFTVGGFSGGFDKVESINFINASGYEEKYDIWKSTNSNLGTTTVVVS